MKRRELAKLAAMGAVGAIVPELFVACVTTPATPTPRGTPKHLVIGSAEEVTSVDPARTIIQTTGGILNQALYDPLFTFEGRPPKLVPVLAEKIEPSPDGLEYTIGLKRNARFQDGSPVTAEAVKFSFQRTLRIGLGPSSLFQGVVDPEAITTPDDYTVKMKLLQPFAPFMLTLNQLWILNPKVARQQAGSDDTQGWLNDHSAGSGAFRIKDWRPGEQYVLEADPNYWGGWRPEGRLSGATLKVIREPSAAIIALRSGEIHTYTNLPPRDADVLKDDPNIRIEENPGINVLRIILHNTSPRGYTADPNVRLALSHAFNVADVMKYYGGRAGPPQGPLPPGFPGQDPTVKPIEFNLDKAKQALAKSKWPNGGFELEFTSAVGFDPLKAIGLILLQGLRALNITLKINDITAAEWFARAEKASTQADCFPIFLSGTYPDPDSYLYQQYFSKASFNWSYYNEPSVDRLLTEGRRTTDAQKRRDTYNQIQHVVVDNAVDIFAAVENQLLPMRKNVKGFQFTPFRTWVRAPLIKDLWIED